jgi:uncharacterized protein YjbI with pentapeptide repeats
MDYKKFQQLLMGGEKSNVDFKIECFAFNSRSDAPKAELAKDICAMANNSKSSYLIIGVSDDGNDFRSVQNANLTEEYIQDFCKTAISPHPKVKVYRKKWGHQALPEHLGKEFVIIQIGPHIQQAFHFAKDFINYSEKFCYRRNEVWIRRGRISDIATPEEIVKLASGVASKFQNEREKRDLISQLASPFNMVSGEAARILRDRKWHKSLEGISLWKANLEIAELSEFNLDGANLTYANMTSSNLNQANLNNAHLIETNFKSAMMNRAQLINSNFFAEQNGHYLLADADLFEADLTGATFKGVASGEWCEDEQDIQLQAAARLEGATMPNGKKYNGCYNLKGDLASARNNDIDLADEKSMAEFYGVSIEEYSNGQEWYKDFDKKLNWLIY